MNKPEGLRHCDHCGRPLGILPPTAQAKRFCGRSCRSRFHAERAKAALRLLRRAEAAAEFEEHQATNSRGAGTSLEQKEN